MSFVKCQNWIRVLPTVAILGVLFASVGKAEDVKIEASTRWATFENAGEQLFALSVQADPKGAFPRAESFEVVVLMDTSASQTGPVRLESLEVLDELSRSLPANTRLSLLACDVETVALTESMVVANDKGWADAVAKLKQRIPLGTTNLALALETAEKQFESNAAQRTIVYIGDGVNRSNLLTSDQHRDLVAELVENQVTVSALAIGPVVDIANLASLANHTGGVVYSRSEIEESAQTIGRNLGLSCLMPVVWVDNTELPEALQSHLPQQFPPLRTDRDTIIVGKSSSIGEEAKLVLRGSTNGQTVSVEALASPEANNPDMGFLALVVEGASKDGGLTLPALGSAGLREMSFVLADSANAMVKSGQFALKAGQVESAIRIAEEALKSDPNNAEAVSLLNAAKKQKTTEIPTGMFTQTGNPFGDDTQTGDDPFGNAGDTTTDPFGGAATPAAPAPTVPAPSAAAAAPVVQTVEPEISPAPFIDENLSPGDLLADEQARRDILGQALKVDVDNKLADARRRMGRDPIGVKNSLKLLLEELDTAVDVDAGLRGQLRSKVSSEIKAAASAEAKYMDNVQRAETLRSQADQAQRLLAETNRTEESLKQLVEQFNFLMSTHRYHEANNDVAPEVSRLAPDTPLDYVTREESSIAANHALVRDAFERREMGFIQVMTSVEEAAVPFSGDPPIVYPPPEVWQALTARRKERYGAINLAGGNESESKIYAALKKQIEPDYPGIGLQQIMTGLADELSIPIWINTAELDLLSIDPETPITLSLPPVSTRSALRLMLDPLDLTYIIRNEVLEITSKDSAENDPINKVYPVGDLVVPPSSGMMGGMGMGMGGMGMGGGMGGMGMGGGMGGMGMGGGMGGMGGGMGGMGGGMFCVPDDQTKTPAPSPLSHAKPSKVNVEALISLIEESTEEKRAELDSKVRAFVEGRLEVAEAYLEAQNASEAKKEFQKIINVIHGLVGAGYPQPWMYQALSLSMEACDYPDAAIKRVLLSSLDFDGSTEQAVRIANYFAKKGMKLEALELLKDVAVAEPQRYDVYALALPLASEARDLDALRWVCKGILSKAWPKSQASLYQKAEMLAKTTQVRLAGEGRVLESQAFAEEIKAAKQRDIAVRVTWTGDADLDIRVKEPAGTICSLSNPQTISGGVLLGDTSSQSEAASIDGFSEYYVCAKGYAGEYDVLIRRIYGEVSGGKVTVEIFTDFGTEAQNHIVRQIEVSDEGAMVKVAVKDGHRDQPIAAAHLANVQQQQLTTARAVLGQFGGGTDSASNAQNFFNFRNSLLARRFGGFPFGQGGAVGYQPVISTLQEGANMFVTGVVSADRRYVRISPTPFFSGIGEIFTFNFVGGQTGQGGQGNGGFGGAAGGVGGQQGGFGF